MKFLRNRQELEHTLILMHQEGRSIRELSRQLHLGRNTVRRILRAHAQKRDSGHDLLTKRLKRASKLDGFAPEIQKLLNKYPKITGVRIYEELKEGGYPGGISILRERLKRLRAPDREPVIRFETEPGRQGQMDWSPYTIPFTHGGKVQGAVLFLHPGLFQTAIHRLYDPPGLLQPDPQTSGCLRVLWGRAQGVFV